MSSQQLLSRGHDAEGHDRSVEGSVGLGDPHVADLRSIEARGEMVKRQLVGDGERDRVRSFGEVPRARLTCAVDQVRGLEAAADVRSDDDVVKERFGFFSGLASTAS